MVTFWLSSLNASWSGDGKKSVMILTGPMGSAVYFVFLLIDCFSLPPISRADDPDHISPIRESDRHDPVVNPPETVESLFRLTMRQVLGDHAPRISKGQLGPREWNVMLSLVLPVLGIVPFKSDL
jgi:hypothetical protein